MTSAHPVPYDLLVIGGGINGVGIARDAAGRGLSVLLCEQDDLASATSSASSKLIHGGLRYLEQFGFRLVAEALAEREALLRNARHIVRPLRFVMPHVPQLRPAWAIRLGLLLYDFMGGHRSLRRSCGVDLPRSPYGAGLKPGFRQGFVYSDCWVDDARLVVLTARDAADRGARIVTRTACVAAIREDHLWQVTLRDARGAARRVAARALVNAAGPWVHQVLTQTLAQRSTYGLKLVKGSHIVVPRLYEAEHAFTLQNDDRRVIFVYPYERHYTLIGTTEIALAEPPGPCSASAAEIDYLCRAVNRFLARAVTPADVVWSYCGIRPLFDDGTVEPSQITRDYVLRVDDMAGRAPVLSVFGGKITTYRRLAERALDRLAPWFPGLPPRWTDRAPLPGGDLASPQAHVAQIAQRYPRLPRPLLTALVARHGTNAEQILSGATHDTDLGERFGADLYACEIDYLIGREWARTTEDVLWRRTKAGLDLDREARERLERYMAEAVTS